MLKYFTIMKKCALLFLILFAFSMADAQNTSPWKKINLSEISISDKISTKQEGANQLVFQLDEEAIKQSLLAIQNPLNKGIKIEITIPNADGVLERFSVWESSNFEPELQAQYPDIRSYAGVGITDRKASINFSFSPKGIQTMVLRGDSGSEFIEKYANEKSVYVVFKVKNRERGTLPFACKTEDVRLNKEILDKTNKIKASNGVFKTIRLALSCTGEYTAFHGGTKALALAAMNATMTRVNGIFNKDLALQLNIIANNTAIIYTDAMLDPYSDATEGADGAWNIELQENLTTVITNSGYDIGHLFGASGGGGNAGCIGCVCDNPTVSEPSGKGSAFTSPGDNIPSGDTFDIDFVAHEMGHQLGANHTFSFEIEDTGVNVEPGSGSTIMGYAGITDYNVQDNSDDYFAYASIKQIQDNLLTKTCAVNSVLTDKTPIINAGLDYTIPKGTPFVLTGTGSDPNGDAITYCWEQNDVAVNKLLPLPEVLEDGDFSVALPTKINGPIFRSFKPKSSPVRYMPSLVNVLSDKLTSMWESVSNVSRSLHFVLTARDNAAQGIAQTKTDEMIVTVDATKGPFTVSSQNTANISWVQGSSQTITWTVNNTNSLSGSANVNIKLSTDGGLTFSTVLAANTPNDGSQVITVPNGMAKSCRLLIEPTANIYYAVNSQSFAIGYSVVSSCNTYVFNTPFAIPESSLYTSKIITVPSTAEMIGDVNLDINFAHAFLSDVQIELKNPQGTTVRLFERGCGDTDGGLILNYDDVGGAITCGLTTLQKVVPYEALGIFNDQSPQGIWTLRVRDNYEGDTGTINSASITICTKTYTTLANPDFEISDFVLYPNPNKGNFNIQFSSTSTTGVKVIVNDLLGREIFENKFQNSANFNQNIQLKNIQSGMYLLTVIDGDRKEVKKIVIE
jgi:subtilisin-like proprotein convertase family protein